MEALLRKKREWEFQNHKVLLKLVQTSSDVSVESVKTAGLVTSFLAYLIFIMIRGMLALGSFILSGPELVRKVAPGTQPQEFHEFNPHYNEAKLANRLWRC